MTDTSLVLIVDDNALLQRAAVRLLSQAGYRTCTADDGQAALTATLRARSPTPNCWRAYAACCASNTPRTSCTPARNATGP